MYTFHSRVRYSEVNADCHLTISNIANYFQDCTTFQSEDLGIGIEHAKALGKTWILSAWQILINRFPKLGEEITAKTWATANKGIYANRNFLLKDKYGNDCAAANSIWIYMDLATKKPCRLTDAIIAPYGIEKAYPMKFAPRKIALPDKLTEQERVFITPPFIDSNHHVNNAQYIKIAESFLPKDFPAYQMRADYRSSALLGDTIVVKTHRENHLFTISLENPEGQIFAIIEFSNQKASYGERYTVTPDSAKLPTVD